MHCLDYSMPPLIKWWKEVLDPQIRKRFNIREEDEDRPKEDERGKRG